MDRQAWKQVGCILVIALIARFGTAALWHERTEGRFFFGDSETYWQLGRRIANGEDYRYAADGFDAWVFRAPGYPILLAPLFCIGSEEPPVLWARWQAAVVGALAVGGVWLLARELFGARAALAAGLGAAVYPGAVATSAMALAEAPFSALMLLQLCVWIAAWRSASRVRATRLGLATGAAAGAAVLVRPSWLLFTPVVVAMVWTFQRLDNRRRAEAPHMAAPVKPDPSRCMNRNEPWVGLAVVVGMLVVLMPWWIRNWRVTGCFVPTTLQVGASLYDGLNPGATGASDMAFADAFVAAERERGDDPESPFEVRLDRRMRREALDWARQHPGRVIQLALVKFARMWNLWPNEPELSGWPVRLVVAGSYLPVMVLAFVGAWRTFRLGWPYIICWLPAAYFTLLHAVFVSSIRYRQPAMLALIALAAGAVFGTEPATGSAQDTPAEQEAR